jgi:glycosyltransferase involved in cell wall biosynthesis
VLKFSIIIPLYNNELDISSTIQSVLHQTFRSFELIVVNDGSTDNGLKRVESIKDNRLLIINQKNEGVSSARNAGIHAAKGDYIAFLDADDLWEPGYLQTMKQLIDDFPEASFFGCQFGIKKGKRIEIANEIHNKRGYIINYFKEAFEVPLVCSSSIIILKSCFDDIGMFNTKFTRGEDIDVWSRLARKYKLAFEPTLLSYYVQDTENRASKKIGTMKNYYLEYKLFSLGVDERNYFAKKACTVFMQFLKNKKFVEIIKFVKNFNFSFIFILIRCIKLVILKLQT